MSRRGVVRNGNEEPASSVGPPSLFRSLVAVLAPHLEPPKDEVIHTVADPEEAETMRPWKEIWCTAERCLHQYL